jgi:hypothetical protein
MNAPACILCAEGGKTREAAFVHDIGALCVSCNREVMDLAEDLFRVHQLRPMTKDERQIYHGHQQH